MTGQHSGKYLKGTLISLRSITAENHEAIFAVGSIKGKSMIRKMTVEDECSAVQELLALATSDAKTVRELQDYLQKPERVLYEAEKSGTAVGCIGIELEAEGKCEIRHIAVFPDMRGRQIGSEMIAGIQQKHKLLEVYAETDHAAVGFYRNCGFDIRSLGEKYPGVERFYCLKSLV